MTHKDIEKASVNYQMSTHPKAIGGDAFGDMVYRMNINPSFISGAEWVLNNIWKPSDGDDLPEIDREVIALLDNGKVVFAHRPPEYWDGKNILTGEVTRYEPKRYDKGGWNQPNVAYWLDVELPKVEVSYESNAR